MKFKGDKVTPTQGRLANVKCIVTDVYFGGEQSYCKPIMPRKFIKQNGTKQQVVDDPGKWIQWMHLEDDE